jgi:hypothetical protein
MALPSRQRFFMAAGTQWLYPNQEVPMANLFRTAQAWWGEALAHAFGNPREEKAHQPPHVGPQPFRHHPHKDGH